jgi:hypothetical protein
VRNKTLLTNGFEGRTNQFHQIKARWNFTRKFTLSSNFTKGNKTRTSEFFSTNNFLIEYFEIEPKVSFQPGVTFRWSVLFKRTKKENNQDLGGEKTTIQNLGTELKYSILSKGSVTANFNYINIAYNGIESSTLGFEMLEGLNTGRNYTWALSGQFRLSKNMQLNLNYTGRKSEGNKTIHTGNVQVRAYF